MLERYRRFKEEGDGDGIEPGDSSRLVRGWNQRHRDVPGGLQQRTDVTGDVFHGTAFEHGSSRDVRRRDRDASHGSVAGDDLTGDVLAADTVNHDLVGNASRPGSSPADDGRERKARRDAANRRFG